MFQLYLRELNIPFEQIIFGDKLEPGTFGEVHRGKWHGDVAIKILNDDYLYNDAEELHEAFKQDVSGLLSMCFDGNRSLKNLIHFWSIGMGGLYQSFPFLCSHKCNGKNFSLRYVKKVFW